jgi:hypothetical protein
MRFCGLYGHSAPETIPGKRPKVRNAWFSPGECSRLVLTVLREAGQPLSTRTLTETIMRAKELDPADDLTRAMIQQTILDTLGRSAGTIERLRGEAGQMAVWRLAA